MALNSSDVNAGDDILAVHNNNLIDDIEQHIHEGTDTTKVKVENIDVSTGDLGADSVGASAIKNSEDFTMNKLLATQGIAPGGNEYLLWDIVIFSLDGTSNDSVGYTVDESKVYNISTTAHSAAAFVIDSSGGADAPNNYTRCQIDNDYLRIYYGSVYDAGDAAQVLIFYIA